jgi:hypothetical protein
LPLIVLFHLDISNKPHLEAASMICHDMRNGSPNDEDGCPVGLLTIKNLLCSDKRLVLDALVKPSINVSVR